MNGETESNNKKEKGNLFLWKEKSQNPQKFIAWFWETGKARRVWGLWGFGESERDHKGCEKL